MQPAHSIDALLAAALPEGSLYAVGGRVRDELRAEFESAPVTTKDLDYVVTGMPLDTLVAALGPLGRIDVVGASFSVVKLSVGSETVDVALPRRERSVGVGHREFQVEAGPSVTLEEDLGRRDFRMNMLARALPSGLLIDPYGGRDDIRERRIDILAPASFREDPLRMLRAAQFAARFEYSTTARLRAAMTESASLVASVSAERIHDELTKLFVKARKPERVARLRRLDSFARNARRLSARRPYHSLSSFTARRGQAENQGWSPFLPS
jgi:tRNA nucleotidyltransferase (CCA-adding enzyme)